MSESGNGLAEWSEADAEIRRLRAQIDGLEQFINDPVLAEKALQRRDELRAELKQREEALARSRSEVTRRALERAKLEDEYPYWRKLVLDSRAADTPDFEHFTRLFVETLENRFAERVLLWFAGFPITGQLAWTGRERNRALLLRTTLYFRAREDRDFKEVEDWINDKTGATHPPWFEEWRKVANRDGSGEIRFEPVAWQSQKAPPAEEIQELDPEDDLEPRPDDLYIAAEDGRMYMMRSADYRPTREKAPPSWREVQARETTATCRTAKLVSESLGKMTRDVETQLARRMIDAGVALAAIPSTGLPTRGSYCFLVNLAPDPSKIAPKK
jgi:hypothetical protein